MNGKFNVITAVAYKINCVLEAMFEFMLSQVAKTMSNSCNMFDSNRIMAIKKPITRWLDGFQYVGFENIVTIASLQIWV